MQGYACAEMFPRCFYVNATTQVFILVIAIPQGINNKFGDARVNSGLKHAKLPVRNAFLHALQTSGAKT
jgi:hypothetical protein